MQRRFFHGFLLGLRTQYIKYYGQGNYNLHSVSNLINLNMSMIWKN